MTGTGAGLWLRRGWLAAAVALAGATGAMAAAPPSGSAASPADAALLAKALQRYGAVKVMATASAPGGMTAALVEVGGQKAIVWIIGGGSGGGGSGGGGKAVAVGQMWDANGKDLTREMAIRMGVIPAPMAPAAVAAAVAESRTFVLGTAGPEVTVFMDPNCIFCHRLYGEAQPLLAAGKLRLRVVMVGFLKPTSFGRAAAILMAADPAAALAADEKGFDVKTEEGAIPPAANVPAAIGDAVKANTHLLARSGFEATPTLLYRDKAGAWQVMHHGPPEGLAAFVATLGG